MLEEATRSSVPGLKWDDNEETRRMWTKKRKSDEPQSFIRSYYGDGDECDKYEYFEATQMDKLLLACKAGRKVFTPEIDRGEDTYPMLKRPKHQPRSCNPDSSLKVSAAPSEHEKNWLCYISPNLQRRSKMSTISTCSDCPWGTSTTSSLGKLTASFLRRKCKGRVEFQIGGIPTAEPSF